jgi:hypothetical protein
METCLSEDYQTKLREKQIINENEVAYQVGDLFVAINVVLGTRRRITVEGVLTESKRVLKG